MCAVVGSGKGSFGQLVGTRGWDSSAVGAGADELNCWSGSGVGVLLRVFLVSGHRPKSGSS